MQKTKESILSNEKNQLLTVKETAILLDMHWKNIYYLVDISILSAVRIRHSLRFFKCDILDYLESLKKNNNS